MKTWMTAGLAALGGSVVTMALLLHFGSKPSATVALAQPPSRVAETPAPALQPAAMMPLPKRHFYDSRDGIEYGYTAALSDVQRQAGQVGNKVVMVSYAGERAGRHQVHLKQGNVLVAMECADPCEVVKFLTVIDSDGLRHEVNVERVRNVEGMLAGMALADAMSGQLEQYVEYDGPRRLAVWVDESQGITRTRDREAETRAAARAGASAPR